MLEANRLQIRTGSGPRPQGSSELPSLSGVRRWQGLSTRHVAGDNRPQRVAERAPAGCADPTVPKPTALPGEASCRCRQPSWFSTGTDRVALHGQPGNQMFPGNTTPPGGECPEVQGIKEKSMDVCLTLDINRVPLRALQNVRQFTLGS